MSSLTAIVDASISLSFIGAIFTNLTIDSDYRLMRNGSCWKFRFSDSLVGEHRSVVRRSLLYFAKCTSILRNFIRLLENVTPFRQHATIASWNPLIFGQGYFAGKQTFFAIRWRVARACNSNRARFSRSTLARVTFPLHMSPTTGFRARKCLFCLRNASKADCVRSNRTFASFSPCSFFHSFAHVSPFVLRIVARNKKIAGRS